MRSVGSKRTGPGPPECWSLPFPTCQLEFIFVATLVTTVLFLRAEKNNTNYSYLIFSYLGYGVNKFYYCLLLLLLLLLLLYMWGRLALILSTLTHFSLLLIEAKLFKTPPKFYSN